MSMQLVLSLNLNFSTLVFLIAQGTYEQGRMQEKIYRNGQIEEMIY